MKMFSQDSDRVVERTFSLVESVGATRPTPNNAVAQPGPVAASPVAREPEAATAHKVEGGMRAERAEILRRVTAFRDLQIRFSNEREQYCDAVMARTRAALGQQDKPLR